MALIPAPGRGEKRRGKRRGKEMRSEGKGGARTEGQIREGIGWGGDSRGQAKLGEERGSRPREKKPGRRERRREERRGGEQGREEAKRGGGGGSGRKGRKVKGWDGEGIVEEAGGAKREEDSTEERGEKGRTGGRGDARRGDMIREQVQAMASTTART